MNEQVYEIGVTWKGVIVTGLLDGFTLALGVASIAALALGMIVLAPIFFASSVVLAIAGSKRRRLL